MKPEQTDKLIHYRLEQARETLREAEILDREASWRGVINRSYYAMFYAVLALAVKYQESPSKHSGVIAFFDRQFIKTGLFPKDLSRKLHIAFDQRQVFDYGEINLAGKDSAQEALADAREFIDAIEQYLRKK